MKRRRNEFYKDEIGDFPPSLSICPVCGCSVSKDHIGIHVEQHFIQPTSSSGSCQELEVPNFSEVADYRICTYGKCQEIVSTTEWNDHLFAHTVEEHSPSKTQAHTDSMLAYNLHQQGQQNAAAAVGGLMFHGDRPLAQELEQQEFERLENQPCEWDDQLLAQALESDERRRLEEQRIKEEQEFKKLQAMYGMGSSCGGYASQYDRQMAKEVTKQKSSVGDYYARKAEMLKILMTDSDSGESCTRGIVMQLQCRYELGVSGTKAAWLSTDTDHFASTVGDAGWGCGYRNFQMLLSALLKVDSYKPVLSSGENIPSIPRIQQLIESAWNSGFDKQGAEQLGCKLVNTRKWIGATEITTVLRSFGLRTKLIDFHKATGCDGTHPEMFMWIQQYFCSSVSATRGLSDGTSVSAGTTTVLNHSTKPPLYLQHQGHSRLVVGVEEHSGKEGGLYLLLFDPSHSTKQMQTLLEDIQSGGASLRHLRRSLKQMRCKQYQIVYVDGVMAAPEVEQSKILDSFRVP